MWKDNNLQYSQPTETQNFIDENCIKKTYFDDWRDNLNNINTEEVSSLLKCNNNLQRYNLYSRKIVEFFLSCVRDFGLPPDVAYLAIDIFDRFWIDHFCESIEPGLSTDTKWKSTEDVKYLTKTSCLVSLSCIQLASKVACANQSVPVSAIIQWMENLGHTIEKSTVLASEMTVFKAVRWTMPNLTLLSYVELFLEEMTEKLFLVRRSELADVCIKVVNVTFMFHSEIFAKLHFAFKKRAIRTYHERKRFLSIEGDLVRLAASVVCTSAMLFDPTDLLADDMVAHLGTTTSYPVIEIKVLSQIIAHIILRHNKTTE